MSLDLYPEIIHEGDLSPDAVGSDVDAICEEINKATKVSHDLVTQTHTMQFLLHFPLANTFVFLPL